MATVDGEMLNASRELETPTTGLLPAKAVASRSLGVRKSDPAAARFNELIQEHYESVLGLFLRLTGFLSTAEDLTQTVFLSMLQSWRPGPTEDRDRAYLFAAAINLWRRWAKTQKPQVLDPRILAQYPSDTTTPDEQSMMTEDWRKLQAALAELSPDCRAAFELVVMEGMSYQQAAETLETTRDTVAWWRKRATRHIREKMGRDQ